MTEQPKTDETVGSSPYSAANPPTENINLAFLGIIESINNNNSSICPLGYEELQAKTITSLCLIGNYCFYNYRDANLKCKTKKILGASKIQLVEWLVAFFTSFISNVIKELPLVRQGRLQIQTNSMIARLLGFLKLRWIQQ
jgi:hypothetical protein